MATFSPDQGVNEREPTLISDGSLQDTEGAEYRVGSVGLYVARGRDNVGDIGGVTNKGLYEAGYDSSTGFIIAQEGNSLHSAPVSGSLVWTLIDNLPDGSSGMVGAHYANRHYTANGVSNRRLEKSGAGVTSFPIGMSTSTFTIGVSVTQGAGSITATTGLEYWATEYDSVRGTESLFGSTANTGAFTSLDSIIVTLTGISSNNTNGRADQIRWYKSTDGGGYPDGGLIQTTPSGTTQITDDSSITATLTVPQYGVISVGGLDTDRDEAPLAFSVIFGPFQDSLLGVAEAEPRVLRFTPAGFPDSWPAAYGIPIETPRRDEIITGTVLPGRIGVFCDDLVPDGGLIQTTPSGTTQITDDSSITATLTVPQYGVISVGGLDTDRDEAPLAFSVIFGPFQDSLLGVAEAEPRVLRFTPAGFPDSWPAAYGIPIETPRRDEIITGTVLPGRIGVFCNDSAHVIYRLPRDSDSIFAAGESQDMLTDERGCVSRRGVATFTPPVAASLVAWVARDGIWASDLASTPVPLTDQIDWEGRVDPTQLKLSRLMNDPLNRRLIFIHRREVDTTHNVGIWYLDYQRFSDKGIRVTFANHGPLVDAVTAVGPDGLRRVYSADSRSGNGQVYVESGQDGDDSQLVNSDGAVIFRAKTKEFLPAGPRGSLALGKATFMHDAGPSKIEHRFYFNRRDDNPEVKLFKEPTKRNADDVVLGRTVNSAASEIRSVGTKSYGVHWIDIEGLDLGKLGGLKGA